MRVCVNRYACVYVYVHMPEYVRLSAGWLSTVITTNVQDKLVELLFGCSQRFYLSLSTAPLSRKSAESTICLMLLCCQRFKLFVQLLVRTAGSRRYAHHCDAYFTEFFAFCAMLLYFFFCFVDKELLVVVRLLFFCFDTQLFLPHFLFSFSSHVILRFCCGIFSLQLSLLYNINTQAFIFSVLLRHAFIMLALFDCLGVCCRCLICCSMLC